MNDINNVFTVTQVNEIIKSLIEKSPELNSVFMKGEISNFTNQYKTGHFYFTLKDENSVMKAVMFKGNTSKLKFLPQNGMKVIAQGRVSLYTRDGQYQFYCDDMEPDGVGSLYIAFEQLKAKLQSEGLFDRRIKKPLPKIPKTIGIVTSPTGAAVRDMINVITRRFKHSKIIIFPALVQGENAPSQLISGIKYFNSKSLADVIIIGRGGGSLEELWVFNDEKLARTIASSEIPIVSAVGHEIDFSISDFAADLRAPTPSAAAELVVPDEKEFSLYLENINKRLHLIIRTRIMKQRDSLSNYTTSYFISRLNRITEDKKMNVMMLERSLDSEIKFINEKKKNEFINLVNKLNILNPLSILSMGYSVAFDKNNDVINSVEDVKKGDTLTVRVADGDILAEVVGYKELK